MKNQKPICKILTVDDEMGIDSFFYEFFSARNYEVLYAESGKEAIEIAKTQNITRDNIGPVKPAMRPSQIYQEKNRKMDPSS